jgi:hypothetical protein
MHKKVLIEADMFMQLSAHAFRESFCDGENAIDTSSGRYLLLNYVRARPRRAGSAVPMYFSHSQPDDWRHGRIQTAGE